MDKGIPAVVPPRLPTSVGTLLVLGGSFDPPHAGHLGPVLSAIDRGGLRDAWVLLVPAARSPHKPQGPIATDRHRVAMLRLVAREQPRVAIWLDEIRRAEEGGHSYTIDTLRRLRSVVPDRVRLRLIIGTDQAAAFHRWREPREIIDIAEPLVLRRRPLTTAAGLVGAMDGGFWTRAERAVWGSRLAKNTLMPDNSTAVRAAIAAAPRDVRRWGTLPGLCFLTPAVSRYIASKGLYGRE